jgi:GntR family transcriptional regulator
MDALYVQLAAVLRAAIESREIIDRVPSAATLAQQYEVAKGTAERALVMLREEGVIASSLGRGYFVVKRR